jgi:heat shock protein HtpX
MYDQIASNKRRSLFLMLFFLLILWGLGYVIGKSTGHPGLLFFIGLFSIGYSIISYFSGAKLALAVNGAKEIQKADDPRLWRTVENLAITDGLPMPRVYIMDDPAPNAFATGRKPDKSMVCVTSGLLNMMTDPELEGVIAHELGHIKNYDIRVNTLAFALVGVISMIGDLFINISFWGGNDREEGNGQLQILALVAAIFAPLAATLVQLAISRRREYLADATGAMTTRYPEGLISALTKIGSAGSAIKKQNSSTAHMFFANPLRGHSLLNLFSTHPPIEARIAALEKMEG